MEDNVVEVDILELLKKNVVLLISLTIVLGAVAFGGSYLLPNQYTATSSLYVLRQNNREVAVTATGEELTYADKIAGDVMAIMNSEVVKRDVVEALEMNDLHGYSIKTENVEDSRLITLSVTGPDSEMVAKIANSIAASTAERAKEIMKISALNVIDEAVPATEPSGPNHRNIGLAGAAAGFALAFAIAYIRVAVDTRIRNGEEVTQLTDIPVIGHFPKLDI